MAIKEDVEIEDYIIQSMPLLRKWWRLKGEQLFCDWVVETQTYTKRELKIK